MLLVWVAATHGWWLLPVIFLVTAVGSVLVLNLQLRLMDVVLGLDAWGYAGDNDSIDRQIEQQIREKNRDRTVK